MRLVHLGCAGLRVELPEGRVLAIDPPRDPGPGIAIAVGWNEAERLQGAREAVVSGRRPMVYASAPVLAWLGACDPFEGWAIEAEPYEPIPYAAPAEALRKAGSAVRGPLRAARRLTRRARLPSAEPLALRLRLPDGRALVHLSCALHKGTPAAWLERVAAAWAGADWLVAGWDFGHGAAFRERIRAFAPRWLILADFTGDVRRGLGMPCEALGPCADALAAAGQPTLTLASGTALRFA